MQAKSIRRLRRKCNSTYSSLGSRRPFDVESDTVDSEDEYSEEEEEYDDDDDYDDSSKISPPRPDKVSPPPSPPPPPPSPLSLSPPSPL